MGEGRDFIKQPNEERVRGPDFTGKLSSGVTVASATVSARKLSDDSDASDDVLDSTTAATTDTTALATCIGGTAGEQYKITFLVTLSNGEVLEEEMVMTVRDL